MQFGAHVHDNKLQSGIKNQPVTMQDYICKISYAGWWTK